MQLHLKTWESTEDWGTAENIFITMPDGIPDLIAPGDLNDQILQDVQHICSKMFPLDSSIFTSYANLFSRHSKLVDQFDSVASAEDFNWLGDIQQLAPVEKETNFTLLTLLEEQNIRHNVVATNKAPKFTTFAQGIE